MRRSDVKTPSHLRLCSSELRGSCKTWGSRHAKKADSQIDAYKHGNTIGLVVVMFGGEYYYERRWVPAIPPASSGGCISLQLDSSSKS